MSFGLLRAALFRLPPEAAHDLTLAGLRALARTGLAGRMAPAVPARPRQCLGLPFANPVGLAAGLDKNADCIDGLGALGFGFIEVGTVTPRPQAGNPRPRLFRIPGHQALINRMGFNNKGVDHVVRRLEKRPPGAGVIGVNIGKNRDTALEDAGNDYRFCLQRVHPVADYVTVNISSPNTPGLRDLQSGTALDALLGPLADDARALDAAAGRRVPLLVKIAPDLGAGELDGMAAAVLRHGIDGVIATNTTSDHSSIAGARHADETGGLSGAPLAARSTEILAGMAQRLDGRAALIGVGGIHDGASARAKIDAGASLVQIYTGFVYRGPALIGEAVNALGDG